MTDPQSYRQERVEFVEPWSSIAAVADLSIDASRKTTKISPRTTLGERNSGPHAPYECCCVKPALPELASAPRARVRLLGRVLARLSLVRGSGPRGECSVVRSVGVSIQRSRDRDDTIDVATLPFSKNDFEDEPTRDASERPAPCIRVGRSTRREVVVRPHRQTTHTWGPYPLLAIFGELRCAVTTFARA